jgi:Fe-S-cluster containining protein
MADCLQCGKCCLGLEWSFNFDAGKEDVNKPSKYLLDAATAKMESYGLFYSKFKKAEIKDKKISLTFKVGICQHLGYDDGKAFCRNHENRPWACRNYLCSKAKKNSD